MSEIKFRGKRKDNGEWVYGNYVRLEKDDKIIHYILTGKTELVYGMETFEKFEVIPETVGQFINAHTTDFEKKEIYEGDYVHCWGGDHFNGRWEFDDYFTVDCIDVEGLMTISESEHISILRDEWEENDEIRADYEGRR